MSKQSRRKITAKKNILANLKRAGLDACAICDRTFEENDIIVANSTRKRYCINCAIKKNMVEEEFTTKINCSVNEKLFF